MSVHSAVVPASAFFIPLNAKPQIFTRFGVIYKFSDVADSTVLKFLLDSLADEALIRSLLHQTISFKF